MGRRHLKSGDRVTFESHDEQCQPFQQSGTVKQYIYPDFYPDGYIEVVDEAGDTIFMAMRVKGFKRQSDKMEN